MIATIDGPAAAGKSTVARALAHELRWRYLDSGAIYRAITLAALQAGVDMTDADALCALVPGLELELRPAANGMQVLLGTEDVTAQIRTPQITAQVHYVANCARVRQAIIPLQREFGEHGDLVAEGRDMGTVVFPNAAFKFYLDADAAERARRRWVELQTKGVDITAQQVLADQKQRDLRDSTRAAAPLRKADDAIVVDTTALDIDQVVQLLRARIEA